MKNYVKDNRSGVVTELIKYKPESPIIKGVAKLQLTNVETGEVDVDVRSENLVMDWVGKTAYNYGVFSRASLLSGNIYDLFTTIHLTNWTEEEKPNTPCMLGVRRGYANRSEEYAGTSTMQGTINNKESRTYFNQDGKYVMSFVFDFPTHACNGTFQSILWTPTTTANQRILGAMGKNWFSPYSIDNDIRTYFINTSGVYVGYDHVNEYITLISSSSNVSSNVPLNNQYRGLYKGFRFKRYTSELIDDVTYRDDSGSNISLDEASACTFLSDGTTLYLCYYSSSSSSSRHKRYNFTVERYNTEGTLIKRHWFNPAERTNAEEKTFNRTGNPYIDPETGYVMLFGYYSLGDKKYDNVIEIYDPVEERFIQSVSINKKLYIGPEIEYPQSIRITSVSKGRNIATFSFTYDLPTGSTSSYDQTYDISDIENIRHLNNFGGGYYSSSSYAFSVDNLDYSLRYGTSNGMWNSSYWRQADRWGVPTSHTLLAAPVTKTQSHTMKVTYEVIVENVDIFNFDSFFEK